MNESTQSQNEPFVGNRIYPAKNNSWIISLVLVVPCVLAALDNNPVLGFFTFGLPGLIFLVIFLRGLWAVKVFKSGNKAVEAVLIDRTSSLWQPDEEITNYKYKVKFETADQTVILKIKSSAYIPGLKGKSPLLIHYAIHNPRIALLNSELYSGLLS